MPDPQYLKDLKEFGTGEPTEADIRAIEYEMYSGPDRGAVVVIAALVERSVEKLLRNAMRPTGVGDLFKFNGPLGTFSSRIEMAHALQLIGSKTKHDLNLIRHIRNQFAHSRRPIRFITPVVKVACNNLQLPDLPGVHLSFRMLNSVSQARLRQASNKNHPRTRYFTACNEIAQRIYFIRAGNKDDPINQLP